MWLTAPKASNNGQPITGPIQPSSSRISRLRRCHWRIEATCPTSRLKGTIRPPNLQFATGAIRRGRRLPGRRADIIQTVLASRWPPDLLPVKVYELVYTTQDPVVVGLGPTAIRDFISYLKYGGPAAGVNVLGDQPRFIKRAVGFRTSQSGRFLRTFMYSGFNADEQGRRCSTACGRTWPAAAAGRSIIDLPRRRGMGIPISIAFTRPTFFRSRI